MLTPMQLSQLKHELHVEKEEIINQLEENNVFGLENAMNKESLGELSSYDNHPADHGSELFERGKNLALNKHEEDQLQNIDHALEAMEKGTYGYCNHCRQRLSFDRLQALPTAKSCVSHAAAQHMSQDRPLEEDVLSISSSFKEDGRENDWEDVAQHGTSDSPSDMIDQEPEFSYDPFIADIQGYSVETHLSNRSYEMYEDESSS